AGEGHTRAGHLLHRGADVLAERVLFPGDPGSLVGLRVVEALEARGLTAVNAVERWTEPGLRVGAHLLAGNAKFLENLLARGRILGSARSGRGGKSNGSNHPSPHPILSIFARRRKTAPLVEAPAKTDALIETPQMGRRSRPGAPAPAGPFEWRFAPAVST